MLTINQKAFLDMIAFAEIGTVLLRRSHNGYNVCVGSTTRNPILFSDYSTHPRKRNKQLNSDAAGRYQILGRYFPFYKKLLGLTDFSPKAQDAIAMQLLKEQKALEDIEAGNIVSAIEKCSNIWASLPGNSYGQPTKSLQALILAYTKAGGIIDETESKI